MRCREAKHKLLENGEYDRELIAHLMQCPDCSLLAEAQKILQESFETVRIEKVSDATPLSVLKAEIATRKSAKEINFMSKFGKSLVLHPSLGISFALGMALILFLVLVPLPYQKAVSYDLRYSNLKTEIPQDRLVRAFKALGFDNVIVNEEFANANGKCFISNFASMAQAKEAAAAFASLTGVKDSPAFIPKMATVSGTLYAQAREKLIKVEVNASNKTDQEIQNEIQAKLEAQGFKGSVIFVKSNRDSLGSDSTKQIKYELNIKGDSGSCCGNGKGVELIQIDGKGKTDEQIKAEIESRLEGKGMKNVIVNVSGTSTDSSKNQEIKIEIKDSTGTK